MTEPNKPLDQMTAQERLDLGISYLGESRFDKAIKALSSIRREEVNPETYAGAQLGLGVAYAESGELKQAIEAWSNIRRSDDSKIYAQAQLNLGAAYAKSGKREQAIEALSSIRREEAAPEIYTQAQLGLGLIYRDQDKPDQAIEAWSNIRREEADPETYAEAQFNLGVAYAESGKREQAIKTWSKVRHEDDPKVYALAQLGLGVAYHAQGEPEQAIKTWSNIRRSDDSKIYAEAQLNLGAAYHAQEDWEQAIEAWSNIHREEVDPETYARAQFNIGKIYEDKGDLERAKEAYCNAQDFFYYNYGRVKRILECPPKVIEKLHDIAKNTDEILKSLQIIPDFESRVAHYSRASTAFTLFGDDKNPSNFRLSTIRGVNDPTEGLVLRDYWEQQGISETIHTNDTATFVSCFTFNHDSLNQFRLYGKEDGREATGVSLVFKKEFFSDQPDTLGFIAGPSTDLSSKSEQNKSNETGKTEGDNKKQLIGKSTLYRCIYLDPETGYWTLAQRDKSTFYREHNEEADARGKWGKYYKSISTKEDDVETHLFNKGNNEEDDVETHLFNKGNNEEEDVETHLLNTGNNDNNSVSNENNKIKSISQILNSIFTDKNHPYNKCNKYEKQKILEAIRFILLPLQYLVKHIAFQEEQECRIMYITQFRDEKIHSDREKQWMYVEYEEPVLPHIDKIWLSPGAAKDQDFFRILLDQGSGKSKVRISQNPFRNKE